MPANAAGAELCRSLVPDEHRYATLSRGWPTRIEGAAATSGTICPKARLDFSMWGHPSEI